MTTETIIGVENEGELALASGLHGVIGSILNWQLAAYVYPNKLGFVFNAQTNFKMVGLPPTRQPDVAFVAADKMSAPPDEDVPFAPDLAVEVISRNDDWSEVVAKSNQYLQSGTRLVWVIDPYGKGVFVFRPSQPYQLYTLTDELDGETVIAGFKLKVKMLFE